MRNLQKKQTKRTNRIILVAAFMITLGDAEASSRVISFCPDRNYVQIELAQMSDSISLPKVNIDSIYEVAEEMPIFPGGQKAMLEYLANKIQYPVELQKIEGRVIVQLIVRKDGKVSDVKIARGLEPYLDKEAIIAVETMPKWIPGKNKGEPVSVRYTIPVTFRPPKDEYRDPNVITMGQFLNKVSNLTTGGENDTIVKPEFPGGKEALDTYLKENVKYPKASIKKKEQGSVEIKFVVLKDGSRKMVEVKRGVSSRLDAEALRIVNNMPKWTPGKKGDTIQNIWTSVIVDFKLP
ncbi:energy transducer TonB [Bacteroides sp.]|uniref:energy transducer TonB n=1 Tax=Bacteroides sp. TaxID=29523 RepID=UPI00260FDCF2|nr:energy transducer TonB [Bacteroides sp.]MDD3038221.1 energy transducer TonB [Bacteroides sp.]